VEGLSDDLWYKGTKSPMRTIMAFLSLFLASRALTIMPVTRMARHSGASFRLHSSQAVSAGAGLDTIYALSSGGLQKTGVTVIRISGPQAFPCLQQLLNRPDGTEPSQPKERMASLRRIYCPSSKDLLDQALILRFPGPRSFTGEDVVEVHIHGSRAVIGGVFSALEHCNHRHHSNGDDDHDDHDDANVGHSGVGTGRVRPAERGEFTRRAFGNGRMDLTEVEGLSDLLEAETALQRKQALRQMDGHMRVVFEGWRTDLISCLAHTEAVIDFGDDAADGDIDDRAMDPLIPRIEALRDEIEGHLADGRKGEIIREGVRIALVGPPNAGKSSLMNALARRPAAIVSPVAGTTRDIIELRLDLAGVPCIVSDTAGLREGSEDPIELEGIRRAWEALQRADVKVYVGDASDDGSWQIARDMFTSAATAVSPDSEDGEGGEGDSNEGVRLLVLNKVDVIDATVAVGVDDDTGAVAGAFQISCSTGVGIPELEAGLTARIEELLERSTDEGALITRERHRAHMQECLVHLHGFLATTSMMDVASEELRLAMMELGKVTGRVDVEELLDVIFRDFCIGK